jgi:hypothetical protein
MNSIMVFVCTFVVYFFVCAVIVILRRQSLYSKTFSILFVGNLNVDRVLCIKHIDITFYCSTLQISALVLMYIKRL